jgi:type VI secretion system secreted protein VgrG
MTLSSLVSQDVISLKLSSPIEGDLAVREIRAVEELDEPFEVKVILVSKNREIDFKKIVGLTATVQIDLTEKSRYFNGVIGDFRQFATSDPASEGIAHYEMTIYPQFWLLKLVSDCRVFQNETPNDIIKEVLNENGITDLEFQCQQAGQAPREYCLQYNETTFDFVSRLMEEEGAFYYFRHEEGKHTMVICDNLGSCSPCPGAEQIDYEPSRSNVSWLNLITKCDPKQQVVSRQAVQMDYNMTTSDVVLKSMMRSTDSDNTKQGERFFYPGVFDDEDIPKQDLLEKLTRVRLEEYERSQWEVDGHSTSPFFLPGYSFTLQNHHRPDLNKGYLLRKVVHEFYTHIKDDPKGSELYRNHFEAFDSTLKYRPLQDTPKPKIYSTQTATVTGPEKEEIWTDKYGRIKIQFHWDRRGPKNEKSSCWVRVLQGWGGNDWGVLFTPRIGMEAMITFLDGNPDRPLVTGCYYNSTHMPPYLPERVTDEMIPTMSTIKSNSSKGGHGFNELRFNDLKGQEQVYFRAEKDDDSYIIESQTKHVQKGSVWESIDKGDVDVAIYGDSGAVPKKYPVGQEHPVGAGDQNLEITRGNRRTTFLSKHGAVEDTYRMVKGDRHEQIDKGNVFEIQEHGDHIQSIATGNKHHVIGKGDHSLMIKTGNNKGFIDKGDRTFEIKRGNDSTFVEKGNQYRMIDRGDRKTLIRDGNHAIKIDLGNHCTTIEIGNHGTHIIKGDKRETIDVGDKKLMIYLGNNSEMVDGKYDGMYSRNYTLMVGGNVQVMAGGNIEFIAGGNISMLAGGSISMTAAASISATAAASISATAGASVSVTAGGECSILAGGMCMIEVGGLMDISVGGAMITNAGGAIMVNAGGALMQQAGGFFSCVAGAAMNINAGGLCNVGAGGVLTLEGSAVVSIPPPDVPA